MTVTRSAALLLASLLFFWPGPAAAEGTTAYQVQPASSTLKFSARSMVGTIAATMGFQSGRIITGPTGQILSAEIVVDARTISGSGIIKNQLSGKGGFNIAQHPQVVFRATQVTQRGGEITINGDLTMRGVTKPARFSGTIRGPNAGLLAINVTAELDRTAWGLNAGRPLYSRKAKVAIRLNAQRGA